MAHQSVQLFAPPEFETMLAANFGPWENALRSFDPRVVFFPASEPIHYLQTTYAPTENVATAINALRAELAKVRVSLRHHQELLEQILTAVQGNVEEIEVEKVDNVQARSRILELFKDPGVSLFYDEIAERLKLPLRQTVDICNQLESEGLIGEPVR
jgi:hypothetical protein